MTMQTFPALFAAAVAARPGATAVRAAGTTLSYAELDRASSRLAHQLIERGAGPEKVIAVELPRSPRWVVALLAVLKSGACYLPVDPTHHPERIAALHSSARPTLTIRAGADGTAPDATATESTAADATATDVLVLGEEPDVAMGYPETAPTDTQRRARLLPEHPAYVIHTSGSTGTPKGVQVTHTGLTDLLTTAMDRQGIGPGSRVLQGVSPNFDVSLGDLVTGLLSGATLVLPASGGQPVGNELLALLRDHAVTHLATTPGVLGTLVPTQVPTPLTLTVGGEALSAEMLALWSAHHQVLLAYGPSEATVQVTLSHADDARIPSLGRPGEGVRIHVLDGALRRVADGETGELYIAGPCLARGYLGSTALTAERFVADRFGPPGTRMYRSGDLVRTLPDGTLRFMGRADDQVKVRGHRIEPAEVEAALATHPEVRQVCVVARPTALGQQLVACTVAAGAVSPRAAELREFVRGRLPDYMVPGIFVELSELPLTANGKVDRAALTVPAAPRTAPPVPPRNDAERRMAALWTEILGGAELGIDDDFLERGGHSLQAAQIVSRTREAYGVDVPVRGLFDHPTVRAFTELVAHAGGATVPAIAPAAGDPQLSFAQQRLWFLDQVGTDSALYNVQGLWRIVGRLDVGALERAINEVRRRHDVLRSTFVSVAGLPRVVIGAPGDLPLIWTDLSGLDPERAGTEARAVARRCADEPFDLARGPLMRTRLMRTDDATHYLAVTFQHIVVDGWSMNVFWAEVSALYDGLARGRSVPLPELPVQYTDYAAWQRTMLDDSENARHLAFWREQLAGAPDSLDLPTDRPRPRTPSGRGAQVDFTVPVAVADELRALGRAHGASLFMVLLAGFDVLLAKHSASSDIVTGSPVSGRVRPELDKLIGFFVNTIPLRLRWSGDPHFTELLRQAREVTLDAYAHEAYPFEHVVAELTGERDLGRNPVFQVWFDVDSVAEPTLPGDLECAPVPMPAHVARFDLEMYLEDRDGLLSGRLVHSTDLFTGETAAGLVRQFLRLLAGIAERADRPLSQLSALEDREREMLLVEWNRDPVDVHTGGSIVDTFTDQLARTPDRTALADGQETLTYAELEARANQVANALRARGCGPEQVIGVCMNRGVDVFVLMLGIMKAGGVYLPLDPIHPADRLGYMLESAGASLVVYGAGFEQCVAGGTAALVGAGEFLARAGAAPTTRPERKALPGHLSHVLFTSGSTGRPKGIGLCDSTLENLVGWKLADGHGHRRVAQLSSIGFDVALQEFYVTLAAGGTLTVIDDRTREDLDRLLDVLAEKRVQRMYSSPSMLQQLAATWARRADRHTLPLTLTEVIVGGEALRLTTEIREFLAALDGAVLENQYGPAETHAVTRLTLGGEPACWPARPPIGTPLPNVAVYVLDERLRPVPVGVRGEAYLRSSALARGYIGRPSMTAARYVADPFSGEPGSRMYRTGDVARWTTDGRLEFAGRTDDQVKIRGFRIEPAEVEVVISTHPQVQNAAVLVHPGPGGGLQLTAYIVPVAGGTAPAAKALKDFLRTLLPDYMIPVSYVPLPELPLNPNGKVDRRALPEPDAVLGGGAVAEALGSAQEEIIAGIWTQVLAVGPVGPHDNFFDLGGHSLLATQVVSRVREAFAVTLPVRALFENPTVSLLAQKVEEVITAEVLGMTAQEMARFTSADDGPGDTAPSS
ncbi:amino acid adenylation domain-containing protein [Streptomyces sp. NPDC052069]|uniref:amino acid adenylation domain-containing protein n=1 Tax=Streptomyces sp. NPDC052069 TaxID=3154650 RepID=UPI00341E8D2E